MSNSYQVAIVDDEAVCISNLCNSLTTYNNIHIVGTAQTVSAGKKLILEKQPDLLFLDVEIPETSGLELLHEIRNQVNWQMQVIFYTAYEKYLLDALRESAFDYLLKPYEQDKFAVVMDRFFASVKQGDMLSSFINSLSRLIPENKTFLVATVTGYLTLRPEQIGYFEYIPKNFSNTQMPPLLVLHLFENYDPEQHVPTPILHYAPSLKCNSLLSQDFVLHFLYWHTAVLSI